MTLTNNQFTVICTIHQEPKYQFIYDEAKMAKDMEKLGLLKSIGNKMFEVTKKGEKLYTGNRK